MEKLVLTFKRWLGFETVNDHTNDHQKNDICNEQSAIKNMVQSEDYLRICFDNGMAQVGSFYSCELCGIGFRDQSEASSHIDGWLHKSEKDIRYSKQQISSNFDAEFYEMCVRNSVVFLSSFYKCIMCHYVPFTKEEILDHISSKMHQENMEIHSSGNVTEITIVNPGHIASISVEKQLTENMNESESYLRTCFDNSIVRFGNFYWCESCKIGLRDQSEVFSHINGWIHLSENCPKLSKQPLSLNLNQEFLSICVHNSIVFLSSSYKCLMCHSPAFTKNETLDHISSRLHEENMGLHSPKYETIMVNKKQRKMAHDPVNRQSLNDFIAEQLQLHQNNLSTKKYSDEHPIKFDNSYFITCFRNLIVFYDNSYYCYLCNKMIEDSVTVHIEDTDHQSLKRSTLVEVDQCSWIYKWIPEFSELWCLETIVSLSENKLSCLACDKNVESFADVIEHMRSIKHKNNIKNSSTIPRLLDAKHGDTDEKIEGKQEINPEINKKLEANEEQRTNELDEIQSFKSKFFTLFKNSITFYNRLYFCILCRLNFVNVTAAQEHIKNPIHQLLNSGKAEFNIGYISYSYKKFVLNNIVHIYGEDFGCTVCGSYITGLYYVNEHIPCEKYIQAVGIAFKNNTLIEELRSDIIVCFNNFVTIKGNFYFCNICKKGLGNFQYLIDHMQESKHSLLKLKRRKVDVILPHDLYKICVSQSIFSVIEKKQTRYMCFICNIHLNTHEDILSHILGKQHENNSKAKKYPIEDLIEMKNVCVVNLPTISVNSAESSVNSDDTFFIVSNLSEAAEQMLSDPDSVAEKIAESLDANSEQRRKETEIIIRDLETIVGRFIGSKAWPFGSRISRLGSETSDLDIFLDCNNRYYRGHISDDVGKELRAIENVLKSDSNIWKIHRTIVGCRVPIIQLNHVPTGVECDISITNGLSYENTQLLKTVFQKLPLCRKLILFIKQWIHNESLSGKHGITSYAVAWMVIYYLQTKSILPTIDTLIKQHGKSIIIGDWEAGVNLDFCIQTISYKFKTLLKGFFWMYAEFDYRNTIICPLLGKPIRKSQFLDPFRCLPVEMDTFKRHIQSPHYEFVFRSPIVVQDPFDLSSNITKAVDRPTFDKFRKLCLLSLKKMNDDYKL